MNIHCFVVDIFNNAGWLISIVILGIVKTTRALILVHLGELNRESSGPRARAGRADRLQRGRRNVALVLL